MMGYNDHGGDTLNMPVDSTNFVYGRKLRPLVPIPSSSTDHVAASASSNNSSYDHVVITSSRWNPTPEQLQTLEELYRRGTRTPSAEEIQQITLQLRRYGKIEGKNVFYWFQNHKARERQKRRRRQFHDLLRQEDPTDHHILLDHHQIVSQPQQETKDSGGMNKTSCNEVEGTINWGLPTYCSLFSEKLVSTQRTAEKAERCEGREIGCRRNATWHMPSCSPPTCSLINSSVTAAMTPLTETVTLSTTTTTVTKDVVEPYGYRYEYGQDLPDDGLGNNVELRHETLQLFPLGNNNMDCCSPRDRFRHDNQPLTCFTDSEFSPHHRFIEFLPLKN